VFNQIELVKKIKEKLITEKNQLTSDWSNPLNTETKHFIVENLIPKEWCDEIYNVFPKNSLGFFDKKTFREKKRTSAKLSNYDKKISDISYALQDPEIIYLIQAITKIKNLEPDPTLYAGGLSMMFKGDFLNPHIDNSHDANREKYRRLNLLYYVSPGWKLENGANFELWNKNITNPKTIVSKFNRLVVMETTKYSYHSVSKNNINKPRCCVSSYYFSKQSPEYKNYFHVTSFTGRPNEKIKRIIGPLDNLLRNTASNLFKMGRGKKEINIKIKK